MAGLKHGSLGNQKLEENSMHFIPISPFDYITIPEAQAHVIFTRYPTSHLGEIFILSHLS